MWTVPSVQHRAIPWTICLCRGWECPAGSAEALRAPGLCCCSFVQCWGAVTFTLGLLTASLGRFAHFHFKGRALPSAQSIFVQWTGFLSELLAHRRLWTIANNQYLLTLTCWSCCEEPGNHSWQTPHTRNIQQKSFFQFDFLSDFITLINWEKDGLWQCSSSLIMAASLLSFLI